MIAIRQRMLGHLNLIDGEFGARTARALRMEGKAERIKPAVDPVATPKQRGLSIVGKARPRSAAAKLAFWSPTAGAQVLFALRGAARAEGAPHSMVAPRLARLPTAPARKWFRTSRSRAVRPCSLTPL